MKRTSPAVALVLFWLLPAAARAQAAAPAGSGSLDAVVNEIRLLRRAIEKQSAASARAQVLLGRLTLQDQRAARARQTVERLEGEQASSERERDHFQTAARETARALEQATEPERRQQLESETRAIRARLADAQAQIPAVEARLAQARQALDAESSRYDELEASLRDLDEELRARD